MQINVKIKVNQYKNRFNSYQSQVPHSKEIIKIVMLVNNVWTLFMYASK